MSDNNLIDLTETVGDTTVTNADLLLIGHYLLNLVVAARFARHVSPAGTIDYAEPGDLPSLIVTDFVRWCQPGTEQTREAGARLLGFAVQSGWMREQWQAFVTEAGAA